MSTTGQRGQASVEFVAVLPVLALVAAIAWQAASAGQTVWLSAGAARAAARAQAIGADATAAARSALPPRLARRVHVRPAGDGGVEVALGVPAVVSSTQLGTVHARARFAPQTAGGP